MNYSCTCKLCDKYFIVVNSRMYFDFKSVKYAYEKIDNFIKYILIYFIPNIVEMLYVI
jgi:hypothetical protein